MNYIARCSFILGGTLHTRFFGWMLYDQGKFKCAFMIYNKRYNLINYGYFLLFHLTIKIYSESQLLGKGEVVIRCT
jgi:hypothetical protein